MSEGTTVGKTFAEAYAGRDVSRIQALLHPDVDFHGLTPNRTWEARGAAKVVDEVLQPWFDDFEDGAKLVGLSSHSFAGTYRFTGRDAEDPFACEQHALGEG